MSNDKPREDEPHMAGGLCICGNCPVICDVCAGGGKVDGGNCVHCDGTGKLAKAAGPRRCACGDVIHDGDRLQCELCRAGYGI